HLRFTVRVPRNDVESLHNCMPNIAAMWLDPEALAEEVAPAVEISSDLTRDSDLFVPDSRRAWIRLAVAVLIGSLGSVGMWSVVVALPVVQTEFAARRGTASLAFTLILLGFGSRAVLTGELTGRYGIGGAIWPTLVNHGIETMGWRNTHIALGIFTAVGMTLALIGLRMLMGAGTQRDHENAPAPRVDLRLSTNALTVILSLAAIACCV